MQTAFPREHGFGTKTAVIWLLLLLAVAVGGCSSTANQPSDGRFHAADAEIVFDAGFSYIQDIYIRERDIGELVLIGLNGLRRIDPALAAVRQDRNGPISLVVSGEVVLAENMDAAADAATWARLAGRMVTAGQSRSEHLRAASAEEIYTAVFESVANQLDPYTRYSSAEVAREERAKREGFGGIGVSLKPHADGAVIAVVKPDQPAAEAGLLPEDRIISVAGEPVAGYALRRIVDLLRGRVGTPVEVTVRRDARAEPFSVSIERTHIVERTVFSQRDGNFAYIRLTGFNQDTSREMKEAAENARDTFGDRLRGLILDVRGNPGGLLDQAVESANLFLREGPILRTRGRHPRSQQFFDAEDGDISGGLPIAVLLDGASASAAEIVASALQDQGRAIVIGASSFGKGTVQQVLRLPNDGELILTWASMHAPSGYTLNRFGVLPTICTSKISDSTAALHRLMAADGSATRHDFETRRAAGQTEAFAPETVKSLCPWQPREGKDLDLEIAESVLNQRDLYDKMLALARPSAGS